MTDKSKQDLRLAYDQLCAELSTVLYEEDPAQMGKSIHAPLDEYEGEARQLAAGLRDLTSRDQIEALVQRLFQTAPKPLVDRVMKAATKFRWGTAK